MKKNVFAVLTTIALAVAVSEIAARGQGTITFNQGLDPGGLSGFSLGYFGGISFRMDPYIATTYEVRHVGAGRTGHPNNGTAHIEYVHPADGLMGVVFAWTNAAFRGQSFHNGDLFGLTSVDLADPVAPSLSPVAITFNGFKLDNSMVSQTFTVGGGGSTTFQTFQFNSAFALGLTRVEIPSAAWAMDNLVWVPEPSTAALFLVGLLAWAAGRRQVARWFP
jgi:hypothetical protein